MGVQYFNPSSSGNSGSSLLYRPKITPITNLLYGGGFNITSIPVVRSGVTDKVFIADVDTTQIKLVTFSVAGAQSTVASITFTTYLASSNAVGAFLSSTDNCLYVLLNASTSYLLIKINDTTGVVTAIGSSFTPTTATNWPVGWNNSGGKSGLELDVVSGHMKVTYNGFTHLINKTTGAIVSQNTAIILGSYLAKNVMYVTQDGVLGLTSNGLAYSGDSAMPVTPSLIHTSYGQLGGKFIASSLMGITLPIVSFTDIGSYLLQIDSDKILTTYLFTSTGVNKAAPTLYLRTEIDKYLKSVADYAAGVI